MQNGIKFAIYYILKSLVITTLENTMKLHLGKYFLLIITTLVLVFMVRCGDDNVSGGDVGTLVVRLTDAPFPIDLVDEANVTINKIELRESADGDDPFLTLVENAQLPFNLLDLQNAVTGDLVQIEIPVGSYNLVRLYVSEANVILKDGTNFDLTVPSGAQTGIKIFIQPAIEVVGGLTSELLLDFDVGKSFVVQGNPNTPAGINGFIFTPVIRAVNMSTAGRITGLVRDNSSAVLPNAEVWIEQESVVSTTFTDETGAYALIGVPAGDYSVYTTKADHDTVSASGLVVVAGNETQQDFELTPKQ